MLFNNSLCGLCVEVSDVGCFDIYIVTLRELMGFHSLKLCALSCYLFGFFIGHVMIFHAGLEI